MLVMVVSTQGDGDPPDDARGLIEFLQSRRAPKLDQLVAVLALGDSSYPKFCETGKQVDERLVALGARRLVERVDCDVDYDTLANAWLDRVVTGAREAGRSVAVRDRDATARGPVAPRFSREQPFAAEVSRTIRLRDVARPGKSVTSKSVSRAPASRMRRATRLACGTRIRRSSSAKCCRRCVSTASFPSNSTAPRSRCANG